MSVEARIEDGIFIASYPKGMNLDLDAAKRVVSERLVMQGGRSYPLVIHINGLIASSKEVRTFMADEGIRGVSLGAFVVEKKYEEMLVNLFLSIDVPKVPTRVFDNEKDAIAWINENRTTI